MRIGKVLSRWRWAQQISIRNAAKEIGVSAATLSRIENGKSMDGTVLARVLTWLLREVD